ncbi:MAG: hypothetical protein KYX69_09775 [Sphingomonas sp.]|uniref:hypothetical protein n=1 Tax=Sphingomonas sp. TaxID=28214 RepID=UPI00261FE815|nr:hypothetical protein [Sphingomonas sp.]MDK2767991.1 hypothetical protein [Sphingomonas sp.]
MPNRDIKPRSNNGRLFAQKPCFQVGYTGWGGASIAALLDVSPQGALLIRPTYFTTVGTLAYTIQSFMREAQPTRALLAMSLEADMTIVFG